MRIQSSLRNIMPLVMFRRVLMQYDVDNTIWTELEAILVCEEYHWYVKSFRDIDSDKTSFESTFLQVFVQDLISALK